MPITPNLIRPGMGTLMTAIHRAIFSAKTGERYLPGGALISGAAAADPGNTGDVRKLRAGTVMGKITASGKYAPSIIGVTAEELANDETALDVAEAVGDEIVRRIGASGSFKLTGPASSGGTVRTVTVAYSGVAAASGGTRTITITAANVNEVQTLAIGGTISGGTFRLGITQANGEVAWTDTIAHNATFSTVISNANTALDNLLGASQVVASGSDYTAITLTFSGSSYDDTDWPLVQIDVGALTGATTSTVTGTTAGVLGTFIAGSFIQPTDGSETPITFLPDGYPLQVNYDNTDYDVDFPSLPISGTVDSSQLVNWPSDTSLRAWLIAALKTNCTYVFDSAF